MKLFKKIPIRFEDKEFEIRVLYYEAIITVERQYLIFHR